jgi:SAM-dependent methyltransferase
MPAWWRDFFESPDSLRLAFFPEPDVTHRQVQALDRWLAAWAPRRALDLCCGAGRHLVPLAQRRYRMVGVDASEFMTNRAQAAARETGARPGLVRAEAQHLPLRTACFDAVLCLFNSFGYLETDAANEAVLAEVARCLTPGGRFLLDTRNRDLLLSHLPFSQILPLEQHGAVWLECTADAAGRRLLSRFRSPADGRLLHRASIRVYALDELQAMLARARLHTEAVLGGYDGCPFTGDSRELLILARRA